MKGKAESLGVISGSGHVNAGDEEGQKRLKPPDKDSMTVKVPVQHSRSASSIGPIWNDGDCGSEHSQVSPFPKRGVGFRVSGSRSLIVLLMHAAFQGIWPTQCAAQRQAGAGLTSRQCGAGRRRFQSGRGAQASG